MTTQPVTLPKLIGRPTKLTPELQTKICQYIAAGNYLNVACSAVDISDVTYNDWLRQGQEELNNGGGIYSSFLQAVKRAEAEQEARIVQRLVDAAMPGERKRVVRTDADGSQSVEVTETGGDWLSAATYLERRHPDRWGRRDRQTIDINETKRITITQVEVIKDYGTQGQVIDAEVKEITDGT